MRRWDLSFGDWEYVVEIDDKTMRLQARRAAETHEDVHMLVQQRLRVVQLVHRDIDLQVFLRQRHVLIHL